MMRYGYVFAIRYYAATLAARFIRFFRLDID